MTEFVICYIEGKRYPRAACHEHHLNPRHAGGSDHEENLVWLSANAHSLVHRAAQHIKSGKDGYAKDLAMSAYSSPVMRQRFMEVVKSEVEHSRVAKERGSGSKDIVMEIPLPREEYHKLKLLVSDHRVEGRRTSVKEYVQRLLLSHIRKSIR